MKCNTLFQQLFNKQCIPVGCVASATVAICQGQGVPAWWGCTYRGVVYLPRGCTCWGCTCLEVYLPGRAVLAWGGVPAWGELPRGVPARGMCNCPGVVYLPRGVYLHRGTRLGGVPARGVYLLRQLLTRGCTYPGRCTYPGGVYLLQGGACQGRYTPREQVLPWSGYIPPRGAGPPPGSRYILLEQVHLPL